MYAFFSHETVEGIETWINIHRRTSSLLAPKLTRSNVLLHLHVSALRH